MSKSRNRPPVLGDLDATKSESGVNAELEGFVQITAEGTAQGRPVRLYGQVSCDTARVLGLQLLEVAEAAEHDAMVAAELIEGIGLEFDTAQAFVGKIRARRGHGGAEPITRPPTEEEDEGG